MSLSPLQFAKAFERLKADVAALPAVDLRLLALLDFWPQLEPFARDTAYQTYVDEYLPLVVHHVTDHALLDLSIEELTTVRERLVAMLDIVETDELRQQIELKQRLVLFRLASVLFYAGLIEDALPVCAELAGEKNVPTIDNAELEDLDAFEALRGLTESYAAKQTGLNRVLKDIFERWEAERACVSHERVNCLFVEKGGHGAAPRGRMRQLHGSVEPATSGQETDNISFDNQVKSPDDPFIGAAYDSLKAVRTVLTGSGLSRRRKTSYRAFFSIPDSKQTFTGDSIGLAVALVTYTQLLKPELRRQERFIASEVAVTGGLDESGHLNAVNERTLATKVERAFFSPVKYLVMPEANLAEAKRCVDKLKQRFPRRRLHLLSAQRLSDVVENHNVIRSEKVCMGDFVVRKVVKYSHATKVQIPLLIAMLYALTCILYPKAWIGFDWNPQFVQLTARGFVAMNKDSLALWEVEYECETITPESKSKVGDLDGDGNNEVAFAPCDPRSERCESNANLFVYDHSGTLRWRRHCVILDEYPEDTLHQEVFTPEDFDFIPTEKQVIILSRTDRSYPAQMHLKFWSVTGDSLGWYINAGQSGTSGDCFSTESRAGLLFLSYNNRMGQACLFVLSPDSTHGVSPPYTDEYYNLKNLKRGNQLFYVLFPRTDVNHAVYADYSTPINLVLGSENTIRADIGETRTDQITIVSFYLDDNFRACKVKLNDRFNSVRDSLVNEGMLPHVDMSIYRANLLNSVTYWTDSGWVTEGDIRAAEKKIK